MSSLKKQSSKAFIWDFTGKIASQSVSFSISIFLSRLLLPEDFGLLAMINVLIAISTGLMDMGLGVAIIQRKEVSDKHYGSVFFFNIAVGTLLTAILFFSAPIIGKFYENTQLIAITRAMSVMFILSSIGNVLRIKLRKELEYGIPTKSNLIGATLSGAIGITFAFCGFGVWSLVIQSILYPIISNSFLFYKIKWRPQLTFSWLALKELWGFGFRMFLSGIIGTIFSNLDSLIIGKLFNSTTLGFYYRAKSLNNYVTQYSSSSILSVLFPTLSKVNNDSNRFNDLVSKSFHIICLLAFFLTGLFWVNGDDIILILFGDKWFESISLFNLIIITAFIYPTSALLINIISAKGDSKTYLKLELIKKILLGFCFSFGFIWGIKGYLITNIFIQILLFIINIYFASMQINKKTSFFYTIILPYAAITIISSLFVFYIQMTFSLNLILNCITGVVLYSLLYLLGIIIAKTIGFKIIYNEITKFQYIK